jgi:hypothetical protein
MTQTAKTSVNSLFTLIRDHLATGDKSADMPLVALSQIEQKLLDAEDDVKRLHNEKLKLLEKHVWKTNQEPRN